jgi:hypothetical protein
LVKRKAKNMFGEVRKARAESRQQEFEADLVLRRQIWERVRAIEDVMKIAHPEADDTGSYYYTQSRVIDMPAFKGVVLYDVRYDATINPDYLSENSTVHILGRDAKGVFDFMDDRDILYEKPMRYRKDGSTIETLDAIVAALQPQQPEQPENQAPQPPQPEVGQPPVQEAA